MGRGESAGAACPCLGQRGGRPSAGPGLCRCCHRCASTAACTISLLVSLAMPCSDSLLLSVCTVDACCFFDDIVEEQIFHTCSQKLESEPA